MKKKQMINLIKFSFLTVALFVASCTNESGEELPENNSTLLIKKFFNDEAVEVQPLGDGTYLMYEDVIVTEEQLTDQKIGISENPTPNEDIGKLALSSGIRKWTDNTIVYTLSNNLSQSVLDELYKSMDVWTNNTNVKFKVRTNESNYITIKSNGNNCNCGSANLGMQGSRGVINLGTRTTAVVIIHEIGHTLGYIHEQTRSDRDNHVRILSENIQDGFASQFAKNTNSQNLGDFDILSTMMYGAYTFSKNGQPTITLLDGSVYPRRQAKLSEGDISGTNQAYPGDGGGGGGGGGGGTDDICKGISEWSSTQSYSVGDKVTYQGYLYERDFSRWNQLGQCGTTATPATDICEGIAAYSRSNSYSPEDSVTYNGYLYTLGSNGRWSNQGRCGN